MASGVFAQLHVPGQTYFSSNGYVEYIYGNMPIIITAPHGGTLVPTSIPDRTATACGGTATTSTDLNTATLARAIDSAFVRLLGCHPFVIIGLLKRTKVDLNRDFLEATCGDIVAEQTWNDYHNFIYESKTKISQQFSKGLYLDMHGHAHAIQRLELGYNVSGTALRTTDNNLNSAAIINQSSIKNLTVISLSNATHAALLRNTNALGTLVSDKGYPAVPSIQDVAPLATDAYFNGGYNIERWGTKDSGTIEAIQIECNNIGIRDNVININKFADSLAIAVREYMQVHIINPLTCNTLLPLKLTSFTAIPANGNIILNWITDEEIDILKYVLQRSYDGINFTSITTTLPQINTSGIKHYNYTDKDALANEKLYYRLQIFESNAVTSYSAIVQVKILPFENTSHIIQSVFPNPAKANNIQIAIVVSKKSNYILQLMNSNGQIVYSKKVYLQAGKQKIEIKEKKFLPGLYFLQLSNVETLERESVKFLIE